ncbi:Peptidase M56, BlaR1 [Lysobacter dokdonensis DS-58]|uniref:Peptidase M56, BlaR1 n=1 Tax=Lysobacter dokdonensis DS-58 TaxID=1300345 RepID=A0A0A2X290_9GAMM|nr:cytochrome c oxidase assembly factor Coa1 family protein [Lysobacter dokdonensis]KGQ19359.1 Peptidase M56, BlaR1 [Lysobacter dokdonensis DS-58]
MDALASLQFSFAPALAWALLHAVWQVALIGVAAAFALRAMARASAASRHFVGMGFLIAMLVVPALRFALVLQDPSSLHTGSWSPINGPTFADAGAFVRQTSPLAPWIVVPWLCGVGVMLVRHVVGFRALSAMERAPHAGLPLQWQARVDALRGAMRITRAVAVHVTDAVVTPCAARWLRPIVFVPAGLLARAPADQLEALLAHELAHIARKDWLWNGAQCVVETVLFFHPAVWWLGKRIRQEREHACDDLAVGAGGDPIALAEALASLAAQPRVVVSPTLAANGGSLMSRISRLLSVPPTRARRGALVALGALSLGGLLLAVQLGLAGGHMPDLEVRASTDGPLRAGDYRQISADGVDKRRFYRISLDARGRATEVYEENGSARPIDAPTRKWIDGVTRQWTAHVAGLAEMPTPDFERATHLQELLTQVVMQEVVVARVGSPAIPSGTPVNGNVHLDGALGDADIEVEVQGPKGSAKFGVVADRKANVWTLREVVAR